MMDVFPPQSDSICDEVFVKARPGQTAGETQKLREKEGGGTADWIVSCRVDSEDGVPDLWCALAANVI